MQEIWFFSVLVRFLHMWLFNHRTGSATLAVVHAGCVSLAGIQPSRSWTPRSLQSVWWNACVHRLVILFSLLGSWGLLPLLGSEWLIGSVLGSLSCLMQRHGFNPPRRRIFLVEGIFPLELTWVLTPFPQNSFGWEYKRRSSLSTHAFHRMDSKDPDIHVIDRWMLATKTHPACTTHEDGMWLLQWLDEKTVTYAKISPRVVNPRAIAGECRRRRTAPANMLGSSWVCQFHSSKNRSAQHCLNCQCWIST